MIQKIAKWVAYVGVFLVPLIPFLVADSMFFPFITGKNFAFRIIVEIVLAATIVLALYDARYRPRRSWIFLAMLGFLTVMTLADLFGINPVRSFWSNFERMEGLVALLHLGAYLFAIGTVMQTEKLWERLFTLSVVASAGICVNAFTELSGATGTIRLDATLGNATYLAVYILFNIFFAFLLAYRQRANKLALAAYAVVVVMQLVVLYYTGTRGTILGLIGGLLLAAIIMLIKGKQYPRLRRISSGALIAVVLLGGLFFAARNSSFVRDSSTLSRLANISLEDATVQSRFLLWTRIGWEGFKERPVLGWGQDNFIVVFGKYYDPFMYGQEPWFDRAHNVFVDWLIAGGALGLLSYLLLFGAGLVLLWRSTLALPEKALLTGLMAAYFFHNIFVFDNLISYIYFTTLLAYLHVRTVYLGSTIPIVSARTISPSIALGGSVAAGALLVVVVYFLNVPYITRAQAIIDTLTLDYRKGDSAQVLVGYEKALSYGNGTGIEEVKEQLSQSAIRRWQGATSTQDPLRERALIELDESIADDPGNTRPLFFSGYLLTKTGSPEEGITVLREALTINQSRQNFLYEIARTYLAMGRLDDAIATFKEAYEKAPVNDQAFAYYAGALIYAGRIKEGESALTERFGTTTVDNDVLLNAYRNQNRMDRVLQILESRLKEQYPNEDAQTHITVALIYLELGENQLAIEHLERAVDIDPDFAPQGRQVIDALKAGKKVNIE